MTEKLTQLRILMATYNLEALIIPNTDPHQSEYIADHWKALTWISGFDGSAGTVVITADFAGLWTDSRYFIQAEQQLEGSGIQLMKLGEQRSPEHITWLAQNLKKGDEVGIDGKLFSIHQVEQMRTNFSPKGIEIVSVGDLIKALWEDRPELPLEPVYIHDVKYTGQSRIDKLAAIRAKMSEKGVQYHLLTALDDIAWTFNIRGKDVECNPVAIAYALITRQSAHLFVDPKKISTVVKADLEKDDIKLFNYMDIVQHLKSVDTKSSILISNAQTSFWLQKSIPKDTKQVKGMSIPTQLKTIKNETEIKHIRAVMEKDGVAIIRFLKWIENNIGKIEITELSASDKLESFRAAQDLFIGNSFAAISGYNGHGAIVHYRVTGESDVPLQSEGIYLIDSGGQYLDGTTDITRTIALGTPTQEQRIAFTAILKAHIAVATAEFPVGTRGYELHTLAKSKMWQYGLDYGHGTGHGVGFFLNVHEGPQSISNRIQSMPLTVGMLTSNEPGYYKADEFGMRTENLIVTVESQTNHNGQFLKSETVTLAPIDLTLIDKSMLDRFEIQWLNEYHQEVFDRLSPKLTKEEINWLIIKTKEI